MQANVCKTLANETHAQNSISLQNTAQIDTQAVASLLTVSERSTNAPCDAGLVLVTGVTVHQRQGRCNWSDDADTAAATAEDREIVQLQLERE